MSKDTPAIDPRAKAQRKKMNTKKGGSVTLKTAPQKDKPKARSIEHPKPESNETKKPAE